MAQKSRPEREYRKLVIGIAGGIASGKSLVSQTLAALGAKVIDSDALAHAELADPEVVETFRRWWGERMCLPGGGVDRSAMADIVFEDSEQRERMERFLYPRLERRRKQLMAAFDADPATRAIVINSPLLYEVGLDKICHVVIFVEADRATRFQRAKQTRGWSRHEFDRREKLQKPLDIKSQAADYRVVNNSTIDALCAQVKSLFESLPEVNPG